MPKKVLSSERGSADLQSMTIVGVDCATTNRKTGLAFAYLSANGVLAVHECLVAQATPSVAAQIRARLTNASRVLIALDAPLGWPAALGKHLVEHLAGTAFQVDSDSLFRRKTDQVVKDRLGKAPLEVAANFLARTAVVALRTLQELSQLCNTQIPLAWHPRIQARVAAIEVYPAGTLRAYQQMALVAAQGTTGERKRDLLKRLQRVGALQFSPGVLKTIPNEHVLDSVLCCVAALDFLQGLAIGPRPQDQSLVQKEGWIWVRDPNASAETH